MKRSLTAAAAALCLIGLGMLTAPSASAADSELQADPTVLEMLEAVPGGVLLSETHAIWPETGMELVVPSSTTGLSAARSVAAQSVGLCPAGRVCAFDQTATAGARLSWSTCGTAFPVGSFTVRSIADARSSGYVQAKYGSTVRATAYAGDWTNVYGTVSRINCVS